MERQRSISYLRAKHKVETLKSFYQHLVIFFLINAGLILYQANLFGKGPTHFSDIAIFFTTFIWGIGVVSHLIYVLFVLYFSNNFIRKWEERKIKEIMEEDGTEPS